jgi:hypothetical protein
MCKPIFLLLLPFFSFSQVNIVNRSLTDSSLNIVYIDVRNIIELTGNKSLNNLGFSTTNGTLIHLEQGRYLLRPSREGECVLTIQSNGRKIASKAFRSDSLKGELKIRLAGITDTVATINQILANPFLISEIPGSYYKSPVYITSFTATFIGVNFDSVRTEAIEHLLTKEQLSIVKQLRHGDKILFQDMYFFWPDSRRRKYPPFVITIDNSI